MKTEDVINKLCNGEIKLTDVVSTHLYNYDIYVENFLIYERPEFFKENKAFELSERGSYLLLLKMLKEINQEYIEHIIVDNINNFLSYNIPPQKIVNYLNYQILDQEIESSESVFLFFKLMIDKYKKELYFKKIINDYLGFEKIKDVLLFALKKELNLNKLYIKDKNIIHLCQSYPEIMNEKVNDKEVVRDIMVKRDISLIDSLNYTKEEKDNILNKYMIKQVQSAVPDHDFLSKFPVLFSVKGWYKEKLTINNTNIVNYLFSHASIVNVKILLEEIKKNKEIKNYFCSQENNIENLLISYSKNPLFSTTILNTIATKIPELKEKDNYVGILDNKKGREVYYFLAKNINMLSKLPCKTLLTDNSQSFLNWINTSVLVEVSSVEKANKLKYFLSELVEKRYPNEENFLIKEAKEKLLLQLNISDCIVQKENNIPLKIEETINNSNLSILKIKEMNMIDFLVKNKFLKENYVNQRITTEEKKELLSTIVVQNNTIKNKKRI